ncbi:MAG: hypothetical protein AAF488_13875 [Planctomycetota bacterium]
MRVLRYLIIVAALGAAVAIAVQSTQEALDERDAARSSNSPFGPATASAGAAQPPEKLSPKTQTPNEERSTVAAVPAPATGELTAQLETRIEQEFRSWTFTLDDSSEVIDFLLSAESTPQSQRVAKWLLARTLASTTDDARRIPEQLHEVQLKNGSVLHARVVTEDEDAIALTTMTGIDAKLAAYKVDRVRAIDRPAYLRQTGDKFRERIERLDRTRPSELETVLEESLRRGQIELARDLFHDWIDAGGPARLAERFSRRKQPGLHRAAELLTENDRSTTIVATGTAPSGGFDELTTFEDLGRNIDGAYQAIARKTVDREELQSWVNRVSKWEEWLERRLIQHPGRDSKGTVDDIRQRLQHLRLDLLKKSGF